MHTNSQANLTGIETIIRETIIEILGNSTDPADFDKSFIELGVNSMRAVELIEAINQRMGIELGVEAVFDFRDVQKLAEHIFDQFARKNSGGLLQKADSEGEINQGDHYTRSREDIEQKIKEIVGALLKNRGDDPDFDKSFLELGINSVLAVELVEAVNRELEIELGIEAAFDYPGVKELAEYIVNQYGKESPPKESSFISLDNKPFRRESAVDVGAVKKIRENNIENNHQHSSFAKECDSDIAIIGISGKFAGSNTIAELWDHLQAGDCCITEINREGWDENEYYHPDPTQKNKSVSKWGGLLKETFKFDAPFFNISRSEAERMDPQQRLFLEEAIKAFEDGGYPAEVLSGKKVGVFVGGRASDYKETASLEKEIDSQTFLGNETSILAARLSYFLNLKGPSITVDTACSSSLAAIHLACESIRGGDSEMALAGGVFIASSPEFFIMSSKMGMLSPDGKCRTFDENANGMVLGEGVGALILKRLPTAIEDRDHIYGVIKGSSINHSGKTNGITSPSMLSQKELIYDAYKKAFIHPESISYIEAHGTGTKLGDSIEIKALTEAFRMFTDKIQFCAIGSHKPNFGHSVMSAGIAGVFKILMAMKARKIPPTIGIDKINEHIDFTGSPFFINNELRVWENSEVSVGASYPLRAGISAFGSGGTNCHLVIEEPPAQNSLAKNEDHRAFSCYFIPFSAKTKHSLIQKLSDMAGWLEKDTGTNSIEDISYTLVVGREHFPVRCAFIATSINDLRQKITDVNERGTTTNYFTNMDAGMFHMDPELKKHGGRLAEKLFTNSNPETLKETLLILSDLYVKGYNLNLGDLFPKGKYYRIPLPGYPFLGENYWFPETGKAHHGYKISHTTVIHPLLHKNTSNFYEQRFSSTFTGREFFLSDHKVNGKMLLPGAAYLEMTRAAVELALDNSGLAKGISNVSGDRYNKIRFKKVVWTKAFIVGAEPVELHVRLFPEDLTSKGGDASFGGDGEISFEIYSNGKMPETSLPGHTLTEPIIHCQGRVSLGPPTELPVLDIKSLQSRFTLNPPTSGQCYEAFKEMGIHYGPGHQGIVMLYLGPDQVLAKLQLPRTISDTRDQFVLHPSLLDSGFQASLVLILSSWGMIPFNSAVTLLPMLGYALQEMEIYRNCPPEMWVLVRYSEAVSRNLTGREDNEDIGRRTAKLDIDLCDSRGTVCVRVNGFSVRTLKGEILSGQTANVVPAEISGSQLAHLSGGLLMRELEGILGKLLAGQLQSLGLCAPGRALPGKIKTETSFGVRDLYRPWLEESLVALAQLNFLNTDGETYISAGTDPIDINAAWQEWDRQKLNWLQNPNLKAQVILVETMLKALPDILTGKVRATDMMFPNSSMELVEGIYRHNNVADYFNEVLADTLVAFIEKRIELEPEAKISIIEIGAGTGGTSALLFRKLKPFRDHIQEYCYTDISKAFLMHAEKEFGPANPYLTYQNFNVEAPLDGQKIIAGGYDIAIAANVLHATKDIRQTLRNAKAIIKNNGLLLLNEISSNSLFLHLTFGLMEGWWLYEDKSLRIPGCPGLSPENWEMALTSEGFHSVFFPAGQAHALGQQIVAAESDGIIRQGRQLQPDIHSAKPDLVLNGSVRLKTPALTPGKPEPAENNTGLFSQMVETYVKETIAEKLSSALKIDGDTIEADEAFRDYGLDSILGVNFVQVINEALKIQLDTTVIFDYNSVNQLTAYIVSLYKDDIAGALQRNLKPAEVHSTVENEAKSPTIAHSKRFLRGRTLQQTAIAYDEEAKDSIAIIGMSGRFAKSGTVNELWEHLKNGSDLTETATRKEFLKRLALGNHNYYTQGSFLEEVDLFDPLFFNISGQEAAYMDPQQRIFLEESWKALEDGGYAGAGVQKFLCGVYAGCRRGDYHQLFFEYGHDNNPPAQAFWGNESSLIPARIAYFLDLQGPVIAVDTACSSSLVAIHLACRDLAARKIGIALAGGVFISSPDFYISANRAGMLSPTGHCHTFDESADGFVPGEGSGVVLLKRLKEAIADGDHIYGVIRGTGINQDGATNGITAPSANSQERLECSVYDTFQIDPAQIQMVEAHGTGTKLGDPIEYQALTRSFRRYTDKKEYCAIGSIKTNIGHAVNAAGIAGVIKILLALQHRQIPPSLHFRSGNPNIQFKDSPFYVNTCLRDWNVEAGVKRCAVVSSFGFSGTNAHLVIEEAPEIQRTHEEKPGYLIALSGRTFEQLRSQVERIVAFCEQEPRVDCGNMSYTLLLGRKHFNHRLACIVGSSQELTALLKKWLQKGKVSQIYLSELQENERREQPSLKRFGNQCIQNCQNTSSDSEYLDHLATIADLYIQGYVLEFAKLFMDESFSRISLPTYPFAKESFWVPEYSGAGRMESDAGSLGEMASQINPLLHQNTSDFSEERFSSTFTGREFFLADHLVKGMRVLPGVAYLEMIRAALTQAMGGSKDGVTGIRLKNIVWIRPIAVADQPFRAHIRIFPGNEGKITYEIYSTPGIGGSAEVLQRDVETEPLIHCQGTAALNEPGEGPVLELQELIARCELGRVTPSQLYEAYRSIGIYHAAGFLGVETIYVGPGQVLAKLSLPASVSGTMNQFILHPSLMDAALQASLGLVISGAGEQGLRNLLPFLPFAMEQLEIFGACTPAMWSFVRYSEAPLERPEKDSLKTNVRKFDIDLCDEQGKVCVRMKGYSTRTFEGEIGYTAVPVEVPKSYETLMFEPCWKEQAIAIAPPDPVLSGYARHLVILCEPGDISSESIENGVRGIGSSSRSLIFQSTEKELDKRFQNYAIQAFEVIQSILGENSKGKVLVQIVVPNQGEGQLFSALSGMLKTAHLEYARLVGQLIEIDPGEGPEAIAAKLRENSGHPKETQIRYENGKRWIVRWSEVKVSDGISVAETEGPWKNGGIYLLTGGAGDLGLMLAREIAARAKDITLFLTGRSPLTGEKAAKIKELKAIGARIEYILVDVADKESVRGLIRKIQEECGELNGIIHCAGVIQDNFIQRKTPEEFEAVLAPKVRGLVNLDLASQDILLDFFIFFSSISGSIGNPGQADYSAANAFMDAYARYRNKLVALNERHGRTLSINWPLWQEGGMRINVQTEEMLMQSIGMAAMPTFAGIQALYHSLALDAAQVMVIGGDPVRVRQKLLMPVTPVSTAPAVPTQNEAASTPKSETNSRTTEKVKQILIRTVSKILKNKPTDIDSHAELSKYGFDSISLTDFTNKLNKEYQLELNPTIFFEHPTLHSFAEYLAEEHSVVFTSQFPKEASEERLVPSLPEKVGEDKIHHQPLSRFGKIPELSVSHSDSSAAGPIAIIGMSGIFPKARDVNEFWENLVAGMDCITEIPNERWDWREYYGDPIAEANKTNIKWGGFIDGVAEFDPLFFGISPREAELMDPQQRLLLTHVWKAIEDAGVSPGSLSGTKTGIFVGTMNSGYNELISRANIAIEGYSSTGMVPSVGPNRMSYFLNIHGPSEPIETACSSSLVAIHRAINAIENGTCEMAIAGGVNTILTPELHISFSKAGMLCEDGRCKTFSNQANGYVRGEGAGMIFLKKLKDAEKAGDHIYGVIRGAAENHGGRANSLTSPNPKAQAELLIAAYTKAGIDPKTVTYIETHGTGTELGDPIEINGLKAAFKELCQTAGDSRVNEERCGLGSVKTNIGHLELASGIAGVIKVLLQLKHKFLVKSLYCDTVNPYIQLKDSPFYIVRENREWKALQDHRGRELPRRAGVSSFGFGGVNAHVVIEEYVPQNQRSFEIPAIIAEPASNAGEIIVLSAKNEARLKEHARQLLTAIRKRHFPESALPDIAYTLQTGRDAMEERLAMMVSSMKELEERLQEFLDDRNDDGLLFRGQVKRNKDALAVFEADEDLLKAVDAWIDKGKNGKLLDLWVKGLNFDWSKLYGEYKPRRISLPTYPFAKEIYWVPESHQTPKRANAHACDDDNRWDGLTYLPLWEEQPISAPMKQHVPQLILVVYSGEPSHFEDTITGYYRRNTTAKIVQIQLSDATKRLSESEWTCSVHDPEGFEICLHEYGTFDCLYFISESPNVNMSVAFDDLARSQQRNEIQLLRLVKYLRNDTALQRMDCYIITRDNYRNTDDHINPYGGGITGLAYAIAQGDYRFAVRNIDISAEDLETQESREKLLECILSEEPSDRGELVKFKSGGRFRQFIYKLQRDSFKGKPGLKKEGVYVILGGSGTVGERITRSLIREYHAKVVWIGRKPETSDEVQKKLKQFRELGEPPLYITADASDLDQMKQAVAVIKKQYPVINGAIFSGLAGTIDNSIAKTSETEFNEVLNIKTTGSLNFYQAFAAEPLDFMCYFSSGQAFSFSGAATLSAYASGITFSDTFVRFIQGKSQFPVGMINWGFWKAAVERTNLGKNSGYLEDEEGFQCLERFTGLLQEDVLHQVVCLRVTKAIQDMMNCKEDELVAIGKKHSASLIQSLWNNLDTHETQKAAVLHRYNDPDELNDWMAKLLFMQLRQLGLFQQGDTAGTAAAFREKAGILDKHNRLLEESLKILEEKGYLQLKAGVVCMTGTPGPADEAGTCREWDSFKATKLRDPEWKARIRLVDACLHNLPQILKGETPATDILFPDSSMEMVEGIYKDNALSDYLNSMMANAAQAYVRQRVEADPRTKVRIIEVGAGTGGTSAALFERLKSYAGHIEYCYTDISKSFLMFAEGQYGPDNPYLTYKLWNIEKPLTGQEIETGGYDLAIATNVMHATKDIRQSVRNIKAALKTNGILLLNEITRKSIFGTLTFGLLDGWWLFEDDHLRIAGSPLICAETWQRILTEEGFRQVCFPAPSDYNLGQQIIAAESDGLIKQPVMGRLIREEKKDGTNNSYFASSKDKTSLQAISHAPSQPALKQSVNVAVSPKSGVTDESIKEYVKTTLMDCLSNTLKVSKDSIDSSSAFSDYGVDSIVGVAFVKQLNDAFRVPINTAILFDYTTVDRLTNFIMKTYSLNNSDPRFVEDCDINAPPWRTEDTLVELLEKRFLADEISIDSLIEIALEKNVEEV